jgi:hypothetical protein
LERLKQRAENAAERAGGFLRGRFFLWGCAVVITLCATYRVFDQPFYVWNDIRLARTFALLAGQQI